MTHQKTKQEPKSSVGVATNGDGLEHSVKSRAPVRIQLADDLAAYLAQGGKIEEIPREFRADPPRKPESNYGRGSI